MDSAYRPYIELIGRKPAPMLDDYDSHVEAGDLWVCVDRGELAGVLVMSPENDHLFVENVAVRPERQGEGLGRSLLTFSEEKARELHLPEIRLYTNEKMRENLYFYERLGFEEVGRAVEDGYRRVFLRKRI